MIRSDHLFNLERFQNICSHCGGDQAIIFPCRKHTLLSLDDRLYPLQATSSRLTRLSCTLPAAARHQPIPEVTSDKEPRHKFKTGPIGNFHIVLVRRWNRQCVNASQLLFVLLAPKNRSMREAYRVRQRQGTTALEGLQACSKVMP